jgi:DNA-binding MarR family transcriptional regulator
MDRTIFDRLLLVSHLLQRDMNRTFVGTPLSEARVGVLWVLQTKGPSTQQAIADALEVSARNISALVDALEETGYVQRAPHPTDRRAVLVQLTETSSELMATMQRQHGEVSSALLDSVPAADRASFERGLDAVVARIGELVAEAEADATAPGGAAR